MKRKLLAVIFALCFMLAAYGAFTVSAATGGEAVIIMTSAQAMPGDTVSLTVSISDNPGICGMRLFVSYDASVMKLESATFSSLFGGGAAAVNTAINPFRLLWNLGTKNFADNGTLATLNFKILQSAPDGVYDITTTYYQADVFNLADQDVSLNITSGKITVGTGTTAATTDAAGTTSAQGTTAADATTATTTKTSSTTSANTATTTPENSSATGDGTLFSITFAAASVVCLSVIIYKRRME